MALDDNRCMTKQIPSNAEDPTEALLLDLIGECRAMLREQVRPSFDTAEDIHDRRESVSAAISLAKTGAKLSDAIARLRGGHPAPELRQRITVEKIQRLSNAGEGGG
jgi:hypothetical protein